MKTHEEIATELIRRLDYEARHFSYNALALEHAGAERLILGSQADRLVILNLALEDGAVPVGIIGILISPDGGFTASARLFEELHFSKVPEVKAFANRYLDAAVDKIKTMIEGRGVELVTYQ